jgi:predicted HD phosphohydrolase
MQTDILPSATELDLQERVDALFSVLQGAQEEAYIGEPITQLAHALQCAALAQNQGAPDEMVLGALFHDLGHLIAPNAPRMDELGVIDHENIKPNGICVGRNQSITNDYQRHRKEHSRGKEAR